MRRALFALLLAVPVAAGAQTTAPPAPPPAALPAPPAPTPATVRVVITTSEGAITLALEKERAPLTTANFLRYLDQKKLDGTAFYRAVKVADGYGLIQFGTQNDPKRTLKGIAHEPTTKTGLSHLSGTISMAMATPGTAAGDFFITLGDLTSMDADAKQPGFAAFGCVVEGIDVVKRILLLPTSPTKGDGVMRGQMLEPTVKVTSVRRVP